jgi:hypothetical protein
MRSIHVCHHNSQGQSLASKKAGKNDSDEYVVHTSDPSVQVKADRALGQETKG